MERTWLTAAAVLACLMFGSEVDATPVRAGFVCGKDRPPEATRASAIVGKGTPPSPKGGRISDGQYVLLKVQFFGKFTSVPGEGLEFRDGFIQRRHTTYLAASGAPLAGYSQVGTYTVNGTTLAIETTNCAPLGSSNEVWQYTATDDRLEISKTVDGVRTVETYKRLPELS